MNSTRKLRRQVEDPDRSTFPPDFFKAIRGALDVGLTCEQISAILVLVTAVTELKGCFEGRGLQERVEQIVGEMRGFPRIQHGEGEGELSWFSRPDEED